MYFKAGGKERAREFTRTFSALEGRRAGQGPGQVLEALLRCLDGPYRAQDAPDMKLQSPGEAFKLLL